jgi:hypothetical protein
MATIFIETQARPFVIPDGAVCHHEQVGLVTAKERRSENPQKPYVLRIEWEATTREEAALGHQAALHLADELDSVWAYVAGEPLFAVQLILEITEAPEGWTSNYRDVQRQLPSAQGISIESVSITNTHSMRLPHMPLRNALRARDAYSHADADTKALIDLHFNAMKHPGSQPGLFLMAKAMELAKAMLPGRTPEEKQTALPFETANYLRQSVRWLGMIANKRFEIRHVVERGSLLPTLDQAEGRDFKHDAELVVRALISDKLGIPLVQVQ